MSNCGVGCPKIGGRVSQIHGPTHDSGATYYEVDVSDLEAMIAMAAQRMRADIKRHTITLKTHPLVKAIERQSSPTMMPPHCFVDVDE